MLLGLLAASAQAGEEQYVRAREGARIRVFQDANAKSVGTLAEGELLRVHDTDVFDLPDGRSLTWHEVSSPRGFPVWVYGKYLAPTGAENVLAVTGNAVRMRPRPESSISSYPLRTTLQAGDRVLLIERNDPGTALGKDWVRVWSPPTARGWIDAEETSPVEDVAAARRAWAGSLREVPTAPVEGNGTAPRAEKEQPAPARSETPATQPAEAGVPQEAYRSLAFGNTLLGQALEQGKQATEADFVQAIRAYDVVMEIAPKDSRVAATAAAQKERAVLLQEVAGVRDDLAENEKRNEQRLKELREEQYQEQIKKTVGMGRFTGRGWVEPVKKGKETRWFLRWAGEVVYEVECSSGRYDLERLEGYQVGVTGTTVRAATPSTEEQVGQVALLDVYRIEVLDGGRR